MKNLRLSFNSIISAVLLCAFILAGAVGTALADGMSIWTQQMGSIFRDQAHSVVLDSSGNIYVTGYTQGDMDGDDPGPYGGRDVFLMKFNSDGGEVWTKQLGSVDGKFEEAYGVAVHEIGDVINIYVTGHTFGDLDGTNEDPSGDTSDIFLVKYDSNGNEDWTKQLGTALDDKAYGVAVDGIGNIYVTGKTNGSLDGTNEDPSGDTSDIFLVKYDSNGNEDWTKQLGTALDDEAKGVAVDGIGNIYVTGYTFGDLDGPGPGPYGGGQDIFLVKYDSDGNEAWQYPVQLGTALDDEANGVAVDKSGNIYVTGYTAGGLDGNPGSGGSDKDIFLVKYFPDGIKDWTQQIGTLANEKALGVTVDGTGHVYVTGDTNANLGGDYAGGFDPFVVKFSKYGVMQWSRQMGTSSNDYANGVAVDIEGYVYVTGFTAGGLDGNTNAGSDDIFLIKYDNLLEWSVQMGTSAYEYGTGVAVDGNANVYVTGYTKGGLDGNTNAGGEDLFLVQYDSSGAKQWTRQLGTASLDRAHGIAVDGNENIYITGYTQGDMDGDDPGPYGGRDVFLMKFNSDGGEVWTKQLGSVDGKFEEAYGVAVDGSENIYVTGKTNGSLDGTNEDPSGDTSDIFLVKYFPDGNMDWARQLGTALDDEANGVAVDGDGNIYVTGSTYGDLDGNTNADPSGDTSDIFLVKYFPDGNMDWTRQRGTALDDEAKGVAVAVSGNIYVTGYTKGGLDGNTNEGISDDLFLVQYNSSGVKQWTSQMGSTTKDEAHGVAVDSSENIYVTGTTGGNLDGNTNAGNEDLFLVQYDSSGDKQWTRQLGTAGTDRAYGIAVDVNNNVYLSGSTQAPFAGNMAMGGPDILAIKFNLSIDTTSPAGSVDINSLASLTNSASVTLDLNCKDTGGCREMRFTNNIGSVLNETFGSDPPTGWTIVDNAGTGAVWRFDNPGGRTNMTGGAGSFAIADCAVYGTLMDTELRSPVMNMTGMSYVTIEFKTDFFWLSGSGDEKIDVDVSLNGASGPWTTVWHREGAGYRGPSTEKLDISSIAARQSNVMMRFRYYDADYDYWWQIDDVVISSWSTPEPYSDTRADWDITDPAYGGTSGDELKTVYAMFMDNTGNWSDPASNTITLDTTPPTITSFAINSGTAWTNNMIVQLDMTSSDLNGVDQMMFSNDEDDEDTWTLPIIYNSAPWWNITDPVYGGSSDDGEKKVSVKVKDNAGNWSNAFSDTIILDTTPSTTTATPPGFHYESAQTVSLTCVDGAGIGCVKIYYCTGDQCDPNTFYTASFNFNDDTILRYRSYDAIGNEEGIQEAKYTFVKAGSDLTMSISASRILSGGSVDVVGQLLRDPDICLPDTDPNYNSQDCRNGLPISFVITGQDPVLPENVPTTLPTATYDNSGRYKHTISGFEQEGIYDIKAVFDGSGLMVNTDSPVMSVYVGPSAGYAIIVEGKIPDGSGIDSHNKTTNRIYKKLKKRGFGDDDIKYFNYDTTQTGIEVDGEPIKTGPNSIQDAIENWASFKMNGIPAPLYVIMTNHGDEVNGISLDTESITPSDMNTWLNNLETNLTNPDALLKKRFLIVGACYSGVYIEELSQAPAEGNGGRVIISSSAADEVSHKGPFEPDADAPSGELRSGEYFLEELFTYLERDYSIKDAFIKATEMTEIFTRRDSTSGDLPPYYDEAIQHPLLDDNGDGVGSNRLTSTGDGLEVEDLYLGLGEYYVPNRASNPAEITAVTETVYLTELEEDDSYTMWAEVNNDAKVDGAEIYFEVRPPSHRLGLDPVNSDQAVAAYVHNFLTGPGGWYAQYGGCTEPCDNFDESGKYEIFYFVRDVDTQKLSPMKRSIVYKDRPDNDHPDATFAFDLQKPLDGTDQRTSLIFKWEDMRVNGQDFEGDEVTYMIIISTNSNPTPANADYIREEIETPWALVGENGELSDFTTYYWKVIAVDAYGKQWPSDQVWSFTTDNENDTDLKGYLMGRVFEGDIENNTALEGATVTSAGLDSPITDIAGNYIILEHPTGSTSITVTRGGYTQELTANIVVAGYSDGGTTMDLFMVSSCTPEAEVCDGADNDCDGDVDEDFTDLNDPCAVGVGVCEVNGNMECKADGTGTECNVVPGDPTEDPEGTCDDDLDNDCDTLTDAPDPDCYPQDYYCDGDTDGHYDHVSDGTCIGNECQAITCQFVTGDDCDDNNINLWDCNTQVSDDPVTIADSGVSVTFPVITSGGDTTITTDTCQPGQVEGITLTDTTICADITTDAVFEGMVEVCLSYDDAGMTQQDEESLIMIRCDDQGHCDHLTESKPNDTVNNIVCGLTDHFSIFAVGIPLDSDSDTIFDLDDNCPQTSNSGQEDTDSDGYGNACDCDLNDDDFVGPQDFNMFVAAWWTRPGDGNWNADADFNGDDFVGPQDFNVFVSRWWTRAPWD